MKKLFLTLATAALLAAPGLASAQTYWTYPSYPTYRSYDYPVYSYPSSRSSLREDRVRLREARQQLIADQARLDRDRRQGRWWLLSEDRMRVARSQARYNRALSIFNSHRVRYYYPY